MSGSEVEASSEAGYRVRMHSLPAHRRSYADAVTTSTVTETSQNGWPASPSASAIGITTVSIPLRLGTKTVQVAQKAAEPLVEIIKWWDQNVEPVETLGGWNYREIRGYEGTGTLSNHSSGTAIDINASKHGLGLTGTVPATTAALIRAKAATLGLRWGGDYRNRKDEMHFEVMFSPGAEIVRRTATKYWWVGVIAVGLLTGAVIYRKRFRS